MEQPTHPEKKSSTKKIVAAMGCGCLAFFVLLFGGGAAIFFGVQGQFSGSVPYKETLAVIQAHPEAIELMGQPIEASKFTTSGNFATQNGAKTFSANVGVSGPKGEGIMVIEASKGVGADKWEYQQRVLQITAPKTHKIVLQQ